MPPDTHIQDTEIPISYEKCLKEGGKKVTSSPSLTVIQIQHFTKKIPSGRVEKSQFNK